MTFLLLFSPTFYRALFQVKNTHALLSLAFFEKLLFCSCVNWLPSSVFYRMCIFLNTALAQYSIPVYCFFPSLSSVDLLDWLLPFYCSSLVETPNVRRRRLSDDLYGISFEWCSVFTAIFVTKLWSVQLLWYSMLWWTCIKKLSLFTFKGTLELAVVIIIK